MVVARYYQLDTVLESDTSEAGFTDGLVFFGFEPGATEDFVLTFDDEPLLL